MFIIFILLVISKKVSGDQSPEKLRCRKLKFDWKLIQVDFPFLMIFMSISAENHFQPIRWEQVVLKGRFILRSGLLWCFSHVVLHSLWLSIKQLRRMLKKWPFRIKKYNDKGGERKEPYFFCWKSASIIWYTIKSWYDWDRHRDILIWLNISCGQFLPKGRCQL